jgi:hypothetical protein
VRRPRLQSTLARAVVPVAAGIGFFAALALLLWGVAALISRNPDQTSANLSGTIQEMGSAVNLADAIATDGPIVLNDLIGDDSHIVLAHAGTDPNQGWSIHLAHPADRDATCTVEVVRGTATFTDCEGRTLEVDDLALPPAGVAPIVGADGSLSLDLIAD